MVCANVMVGFVNLHVFSTLIAQFATLSPGKSAQRTKIAAASYMVVRQTPANAHVHVRSFDSGFEQNQNYAVHSMYCGQSVHGRLRLWWVRGHLRLQESNAGHVRPMVLL
jgi:hypothetical protein